MHPIFCIYPCWYDSAVIVKRHCVIMVSLLAKPTKKIAWNECDIEMRGTRGALGRLATKSFYFVIKEETKVLPAKVWACVCVADREPRLLRDDECMISHTSESLSDRDGQTETDGEWKISGSMLWKRCLNIGTQWSLSLVCVCLCSLGVLSVDKRISANPGIWVLNRHQETPVF